MRRDRRTNVDLVLSFPQWQGSARHGNLPRGAAAAARIGKRFGPRVDVPDAGEGDARDGIRRWTALDAQFRSAAALLRERRPDRVLTAGGDCACDVAVIDYLQQRHPGLHVLWFDAHLDANTAATSPSGSFHGMPVATLTGSPPPELAALLAAPLSASQFHYVGAHVGDPGEWEYQRAHGLRWWEPGTPLEGPLHVHFDLDVLRPSEFPHVAYPEGTLGCQAALDLVRQAAGSARLVGLTITEFAPSDEDAAAHGSRFIEQLCEAAIG
jgi:arginase